MDQERRPDNRYKLLNPLGTGGMGAVFRAYDRLTGETVALKQVVATAMQPTTPEFRLALAHEFQALSSLRHPHVVTVRDYGFEEGERPYFTMELLSPAHSFLTAGQFLPSDQKVELLLALLAALVYIHRQGIVHRDLKPGNVLINNGVVKVLDFGLAAVGGQDQPSAGTLTYMAPELLRGQPATVASDLYAVGIMAYELFAGWQPFAQTQNFIQAVLQQTPDMTYLDIPPSLKAVLERLLAKKPQVRYPDATATMTAICTAMERPLPPETTATRESFLQAAPFIGREAESAQLLAALEQARAGRGSACLVEGESGIGKSRLLHELRTRALVSGFFVLRGQAQQEGGSAYHLWTETLRPLLLQAPPDNMEAAVLHTIIPDLPRLLERSIPDAPTLEAKAAQTRLLLTVSDLLRRAAVQRPLLLLLEDLHWIDDNSLVLLQHLIQVISDLPLCIIGSYRPGERPALPTQLAAMKPLRLSRLDFNYVAELSAAMLGENGRDPNIVRFLQRETEGNTYFMVEVMRALAEEAGRLDQVTAVALPATIFAGGMKEVVQRRLARVPASGQPLLQLAAIAGRQLDERLLAHLSPQTNLENWLTGCANAAVLARSNGVLTWQFSHDKLREGLLAQLNPAQKRMLHQQLGNAIEQFYAADLNPHFATLAYHFGQAQLRDKQRQYLKSAGETAQAAYANEAAVNFFEQLLPLQTAPERVSTLLQLANVLRFMGRLATAEARLQEALSLADNLSDRVEQAHCWLNLGRLGRGRSEFPKALQFLALAREAFAAVAHKEGLCDTLAEMGDCHYYQGDYVAAEANLAQSLALARELNDPKKIAAALHSLGLTSFDQGDYELARQRFEESLHYSQAIDDQVQIASTTNNLGILASYTGDVETTRACYEEALAIRRKIGDQAGIGASLNNLGILARDAGDYERAIELYEEALRISREIGDKRSMAYPLKNLGVVALDLNNHEQARAYYQEALALRREVGDKWGVVSVLSSLGDIGSALQNHQEAARYYAESLRLNQEIGDHSINMHNLFGLASVSARQPPITNENLQRAARIIGFVEGTLSNTGVVSKGWFEEEYDELIRSVKTALDGAVYDAGWEEGKEMTLEQIVAHALDSLQEK